jgi:hypothetical protein
VSRDAITYDMEDLRRLEGTFKAMGGVPKKAATKAASKGMTVVRRAVKKRIPKGETGNLKRGLTRKKEKKKADGLAVYDLKYNPAMNDVFQKPIKRPGLYGGKRSSHGYYPNSVEYGFLTRVKGGGIEYRSFSRLTDERDRRGKRKRRDEVVAGYRSRRVPGQEPMKEGAQDAYQAAQDKVADTLIKEVDKAWET